MPHIKSLNSLRFFGAISVILLHLGSHSFFEKKGMLKYHILISGNTGVQLFYVLSGFLITSLAINEINRSGSFSFINFFLRRALRLFPLYYLAIFSIILLQALGLVSIKLSSYIYAIIYSYNFIPKSSYHNLLGSFHTLATEEHFYLFFGLLLAFSLRLGRSFVLFMVPLLFLFCIVFLNQLRPFFVFYEKNYFVGRWTIFAIQPILIGCLGGFFYSSSIFRRITSAEKTDSIKNNFGPVLLFIFFAFYLYQLIEINRLLLSIGFLSLIFHLAIFKESTLNRALSCPPLVYLGTISYGLYVWQAVINGTGPSARWINSPYISTGLVFMASILSYELYEKRFIKMKERFR